MKIDSLKIKLLMAEKCLTQTSVAEMGGVSRQSVSTILGRGTCAPHNAAKLAKALGVNVREIIKEE